MFLEMLFFAAVGIFFGVVFGLVPGLHPNTIILFTPVIVSAISNPLYAVAFLVSMGVSNVIIDFIPSIILGAPDAEKEMAVLPGHSFLLQGRGYGAVKLCVAGAAMSMILCVVLLPLIVLAVPLLYALIKEYVWLILVFAVSFIILSSDKMLLSLACFVFSGLIGVFVFKLPINPVLVLFPVLSGLFGVSMIFFSSGQKIPKQHVSDIEISSRTRNRSAVAGTLGGIVSGFLPGLGSSQVASFMSIERSKESFLVSMGAISLSNLFLSLISLWLIEKSRSGVAVAISYVSPVGFKEFLLIVSVSLIAAGVSCILALFIARKFSLLVGKIDYRVMSTAVAVLIVFMSFVFTGFYGLFILLICTSLGIFANAAGVRRGLLMGVLIVPTILYFIY